MVSGDQSLDHSIIISFDVISIVLIVLLSLVVLTVAASRGQILRGLSWYNFILPVIFYQASFLLLLGSPDHSQPPAALCVLQAMLIYTLPVYCATGFASFVLDFYFQLKEVFDNIRPPTVTSRLLLGVPPAVFFTVLIVDLVFILINKEIRLGLQPDISGLYCRSSTSTTLVLIAVVVGTPGLCVWFFVYVKTALLLAEQHRCTTKGYEESLRKYFLAIFVRTTFMTFGTCIGLGLMIRAAIVPSNDEQPYNIFQYLSLPLMTLLVFGTQPEFFKCCMRRRRAKYPAPGGTGLASL